MEHFEICCYSIEEQDLSAKKNSIDKQILDLVGVAERNKKTRLKLVGDDHDDDDDDDSVNDNDNNNNDDNDNNNDNNNNDNISSLNYCLKQLLTKTSTSLLSSSLCPSSHPLSLSEMRIQSVKMNKMTTAAIKSLVLQLFCNNNNYSINKVRPYFESLVIVDSLICTQTLFCLSGLQHEFVTIVINAKKNIKNHENNNDNNDNNSTTRKLFPHNNNPDKINILYNDSLPRIEFQDCIWSNMDSTSLPLQFDTDNFFQSIKLHSFHAQAGLSQITTAFHSLVKLETQSILFHLSDSLLSIEALRYLLQLSKQYKYNNDDDINNDASNKNDNSNNKNIQLDLMKCQLYSEHHDNNNMFVKSPYTSSSSSNGHISLGSHQCYLTNFSIDANNVTTLSHLLQQVIHTETICTLSIQSCHCSLIILNDLLAPLVQNNDASSTTNDSCRFETIVFRDCELNYCSNNDISNSQELNNYYKVNEIRWKIQEHTMKLSLFHMIDDYATCLSTLMQLIAYHPPFTTITHLDVSDMDIGHDGVRSIAQNLNKTTLQVLSMSCTYTSDQDLDVLVGALQTNRTVTKLDLSYNRYTFFSLGGLLEALTYNNKTLKYLIMEGSNQDMDQFEQEAYNEFWLYADYYLALNQLGRKELVNMDLNHASLLLSFVIKKANSNPSVIYWVLQKFPNFASRQF